MKLNKPILNIIKVFDSSTEHTFTFSYHGEQAVRNRLVIKDNISNDVVYDKIQERMRLDHTVPANTLKNNKTYNIQVQVFDAFGNSSDLSEPVIFSCHTTPQFLFTNLEDIVRTANLSINITFEQPEEDSIKEFKYYLYDENQIQIYVSDSYYNTDIPHTYYGLTDKKTYFIRAVGTTVYGFNIDTGFQKISILYDDLDPNIVFSTVNKDGKIIISTNIIFIDYELENDNYILENGKLTLWDNTLTYKAEGIGDFTLVVIGEKIPTGTFLKVNCLEGSAEVSIVEFSDNTYCKLKVSNGKNTYVVYEDIVYLPITDANSDLLLTSESKKIRAITAQYFQDKQIIFELHRKNNLYSLESYYL